MLLQMNIHFFFAIIPSRENNMHTLCEFIYGMFANIHNNMHTHAGANPHVHVRTKLSLVFLHIFSYASPTHVHTGGTHGPAVDARAAGAV